MMRPKLLCQRAILRPTPHRAPATPAATPFSPRSPPRPTLTTPARHFMPRHARELQSRPESILQQMVAEADTASLNFYAYLPGAGRWNFAFDDFNIAPGFGDLSHFHLCHVDSPPSSLVFFGCQQITSRYSRSHPLLFRNKPAPWRLAGKLIGFVY